MEKAPAQCGGVWDWPEEGSPDNFGVFSITIESDPEDDQSVDGSDQLASVTDQACRGPG